MDERKRTSNKDDDLPIIGDYSEAANARLRTESRPTPPPRSAPDTARAPDPPLGATRRTGSEQWRLDPADVRRHARLAAQRKRVGLLGRLARYGLFAAALVAAIIVYRNFETLRATTIDFSALTGLFADRSGADVGATSARGGDAKTEDFDAPRVAGIDAPTSFRAHQPTEASAAETPAARPESAPAARSESPPAARSEPPAAETPQPAFATVPTDDAVAPSERSTPAVPEPPPEPESFEFAVDRVTVSEADASAAVLVLRNGDRRRPSSVTWWTEDGTAKAGSDYVDLGRVVVKFAAGEQNRTIRIPIIGDHQVEGPETFYVRLAPGEDAAPAAEPAQKLEVVINDAD